MTFSDPNNTAGFSLNRLFHASKAYYFWRETGKLLGTDQEPNSVEIERLRQDLSSALLDVRMSYYPFGESK